MNDPVKISEIRTALQDRDYKTLRELYNLAKVEGIQGCDEYKSISVGLVILEVSLFKNTSPGHIRILEACLDAIERGNHPLEDIEALSVIGAESVIAEAQLKAMRSGTF